MQETAPLISDSNVLISRDPDTLRQLYFQSFENPEFEIYSLKGLSLADRIVKAMKVLKLEDADRYGTQLAEAFYDEGTKNDTLYSAGTAALAAHKLYKDYKAPGALEKLASCWPPTEEQTTQAIQTEYDVTKFKQNYHSLLKLNFNAALAFRLNNFEGSETALEEAYLASLSFRKWIISGGSDESPSVLGINIRYIGIKLPGRPTKTAVINAYEAVMDMYDKLLEIKDLEPGTTARIDSATAGFEELLVKAAEEDSRHLATGVLAAADLLDYQPENKAYQKSYKTLAKKLKRLHGLIGGLADQLIGSPGTPAERQQIDKALKRINVFTLFEKFALATVTIDMPED